MKLEWAVLAGAAVIAGAILIVGRYEITARGDNDYWRLDRWTGQAQWCGLDVRNPPFKQRPGPLLGTCEQAMTNQ